MTPKQREVMSEVVVMPGKFLARSVGATGSTMESLRLLGYVELVDKPVAVDSARGGGRERVLAHSFWKVTPDGRTAMAEENPTRHSGTKKRRRSGLGPVRMGEEIDIVTTQSGMQRWVPLWWNPGQRTRYRVTAIDRSKMNSTEYLTLDNSESVALSQIIRIPESEQTMLNPYEVSAARLARGEHK